MWVTCEILNRDALRDLKSMKNILGAVLLLAKLLAKACTFIKSNTPPGVFFTLFKLYKCYRAIYHKCEILNNGQIFRYINWPKNIDQENNDAVNVGNEHLITKKQQNSKKTS